MSESQSNSQEVPVSFLDVIACAFGAVILLVVILPIGMLAHESEDSTESEHLGRLLLESASLDDTIFVLKQQLQRTVQLLDEFGAGFETAAEASQSIREAIRRTHDEIDDSVAQTKALTRSADLFSNSRRTSLIAEDLPKQVAGIPVDSEYVAFVVDTSGSMHANWDEVIAEIEQILAIYPELKGFQFLSDQAHYLFPATKGRWIPDSPAARNRAKTLLQRWTSFSTSSPERGISTAVRSLYRPGIKMAVFVFGDDYNGKVFDSFLEQIELVIKRKRVNEGALRIHAVGFFESSLGNPANFSILMRELTRQHQGVFLGRERNTLVLP